MRSATNRCISCLFGSREAPIKGIVEVCEVPKWKDSTSYQRGERGKIDPQSWTLKHPSVEVTIHKYIGCGETWHVSCHALNVHRHSLGTTDKALAAARALEFLRHRAQAIYRNLVISVDPPGRECLYCECKATQIGLCRAHNKEAQSFGSEDG